ncbi:MAG: AAA family ATPase [Microthrixaceae bacterium]|nr:AAA family ATPase [Microthrixaceae bacterium]
MGGCRGGFVDIGAAGSAAQVMASNPEVAARLLPFVARTAAAACGEGRGSCTLAGASLVFADISGFTRLSERLAGLGREGTEGVKDAINAVFGELIPVVRAGGGDVLKFGGDALLIVVPDDDQARRGVGLAAEMQRAIRRCGRIETPDGVVRLRMSVGVEHGDVDAVLVGERHRDLMAVSPLASSLFRAESVARPGEVCLGPGAVGVVPHAWVQRLEDRVRVRIARVGQAEAATCPADIDYPAELLARLVPPELSDVLASTGFDPEHRPIGVAFVVLGGTDELHRATGRDGLAERLRAVSGLVESHCAQQGVCWLETDVGADEARWVLVSGVPRAREDAADALVATVQAIVEASDVPLRAGVHHGRVFVGSVGHAWRRTHNVMGDAVNVAARLASKAVPGTALVSRHALSRLRAPVPTLEVAELALKGRRAHMQVAVLGDPMSIGEVPDQLAVAAPTTWRGRDDELGALMAALGHPGVVELHGVAGIGRSRLLAEARARSGALWWSAAGVAARVHASYRALNPLATREWGVDLGDAGLVAGVDPEFRRTVLHHRVADRVAAVVEESRDAAPPVLVIDDAHWLDEPSWALVEHLARGAVDLGLVVLISRRDDPTDPACERVSGRLVDLAAGTRLELGPLEAGAAEALVVEVMEGVVDDALLEHLCRLGGGVPRFLVELARHVERSRLVGELPDLPDTIEELAGEQVDALDPRSRRVLRLIAAAGDGVPVGLLRDAFGVESPQIEPLGALVRRVGGRLWFGSELVRIVAYEGLAFSDRRLVHRALAAAIEAFPSPDPSVLAEHWIRAGDPPKVWEWARIAARRSAERGAMVDAAHMWRRAVAAGKAVGAATGERFEAMLELARASERIGEPDEALAALSSASKTAEEPTDRVTVGLRRARVLERSGRYPAALAAVTRIAKFAELSGDPLLATRLELMRSQVRYFQGRSRSCLTLAEVAIGSSRPLGAAAEEAQGHVLAEMACESLGLFEQRAQHDVAAERLFTEVGDDLGLGNLLLNRGAGQLHRGEWAEAVETNQRAATHYRACGDLVGAAIADNNTGEIRAGQQRLDEATELLSRAQRVLRAGGYPLGTALTVSGLARIAAWRGDLAGARASYDEVIEEFRRLGAEDYEADTLVRIAEWHLLAGSPEAALEVLDAAHAQSGRLGDPAMLAAAVERATGDAMWALGERAAARDIYRRGVDTAVRRRLRHEEALCRLGLSACGEEDQRPVAEALFAQMGVLHPPPTTPH